MRRARGVDDQRTGVAQIGMVREQLHRIEETVDLSFVPVVTERENAAGATGQPVISCLCRAEIWTKIKKNIVQMKKIARIRKKSITFAMTLKIIC
jgi:hypothetical protein